MKSAFSLTIFLFKEQNQNNKELDIQKELVEIKVGDLMSWTVVELYHLLLGQMKRKIQRNDKHKKGFYL